MRCWATRLRACCATAGGALDIDAVLVGPSEVGDFVAAHAFVARDYVADDGGVSRADVRARVRVVDGSGEIELGLIHEIWAMLARLLELESLTHRNARERYYSGLRGLSNERCWTGGSVSDKPTFQAVAPNLGQIGIRLFLVRARPQEPQRSLKPKRHPHRGHRMNRKHVNTEKE